MPVRAFPEKHLLQMCSNPLDRSSTCAALGVGVIRLAAELLHIWANRGLGRTDRRSGAVRSGSSTIISSSLERTPSVAIAPPYPHVLGRDPSNAKRWVIKLRRTSGSTIALPLRNSYKRLT